MALFTRMTTNKCSFINNCCNKWTVIHAESGKLYGLSKNCLWLRHLRSEIQHINIFSEKKPSSIPAKTLQNVAVAKEVGSYNEFLLTRRNEAKRSIIVQVQSASSYAELYSYCHEFGEINSIQYYAVAKDSHFFIIEFNEISSQIALINGATHLNWGEIIPVQSQMLWFRNIPAKQKVKTLPNIPQLPSTMEMPSHKAMITALARTNSISEQMQILYKMLKLDDVGIRLRFLTANQMESSFSSLFPNIYVLPFGSSVNGFGKKNCDLDLVLNLEPDKIEKTSSRLVFHTKLTKSEERKQIQNSMETISTVITNFVPGVVNVRKILQARVPIIKYDHKLTGLECDLSMTNMTAVYMSELLYLYGEAHPTVRPMVFTIKHWASLVEITNSSPGGWITNFSLSLLVLFFLQCKNILPSVASLKNNATGSDVRLTDTCVDCTFVRDITKWPDTPYSTVESLENLLAGFYHFYANFDFTTQAISLRDGVSIYKPNPSPLYICNPLERMLNVSKNVTTRELMKFISAVREAAMLMDEGNDPRSRGLPDIFARKTPQSQNYTFGHTDKRIRIADLFEMEKSLEDETATDTVRKKQSARWQGKGK